MHFTHICYRCTVHAELPEHAEGIAWCKSCLRAIGRADLVPRERPKHRCSAYQAAEGLIIAVLTSGRNGLRWPDSKEERDKLTMWLEVAEFDAHIDGMFFVVAPRNLPDDAKTLELTGWGNMKLTRYVVWVSPPKWLWQQAAAAAEEICSRLRLGVMN